MPFIILFKKSDESAPTVCANGLALLLAIKNYRGTCSLKLSSSKIYNAHLTHENDLEILSNERSAKTVIT